jgi:Protein of unknown function (DUF448)
MIIDETGRAAGRGAYLCRSADCWSAAGKRHAIEHALGSPLPDDLAAVLAAGPDALGSTTEDSPASAASPASAPAPDTDFQGGTHGQE